MYIIIIFIYIIYIFIIYIIFYIYIYIIMDKNIIKSDDTDIEKYEFHQFKYFIGYKGN